MLVTKVENNQEKSSCLFLSLMCRWSTGFPWGSEWQAVHQRGLQVQCGQALWHPLHGVAVHEWLHGTEAIFRFVFVTVPLLTSDIWPLWRQRKPKMWSTAVFSNSSMSLSCHFAVQMWSTTHGRRRTLGTRPERSCTPSLCPTPWPQKQPQSLRHRYSQL